MKILAIGDLHGKFPEKLKKIAKSKDVDLILCTGDFGGIPEWYVYWMKTFKLVHKGKSFPTPEEYFGKKKLKELLKKDAKVIREVLFELNNLKKKIIFVFGNADDEWYNYPFGKKIPKSKKSNRNFIKKLKNMREITYSKIKFQDINFIGCGGYMDVDEYLKKRAKTKEDAKRIKGVKNRRERTENYLFNILKKTKGNKIFVFHYPPKGCLDIIKDRKNPRHGTSAGISFFRDAIIKYKPNLVLCGHMHENQGKCKIGKTLVVNTGAAKDGKAVIIDFNEGLGKVEKIRFIK